MNVFSLDLKTATVQHDGRDAARRAGPSATASISILLASRLPIWSDMTSVDKVTRRREDWSSASVINHTIVTDPAIRQPGFDFPRHT